MTAPSRPPLFPPPDARDRLPLWVIMLLAVFLVLRVSGLRGDLVSARNSRVSAQSGTVDTKLVEAMVTGSLEAKQAYLQSFGRSGNVQPDQAALQEALASAETVQQGSQNTPSAARHVIILRALLHRPLLGAGKTAPDPAAAFLPTALAKFTGPEVAQYAAEGRLWADVAHGPHLTPAQTAQDAALLNTTPNLRWWQGPALSVLYQSQGNTRLAQHFASLARVQALVTLGPLIFLNLFYGVLGLAGIVLLLVLMSRLFQERSSPNSAPDVAFWPVVRETVPLSERRLRAGDLMGVFVLYLLMDNIIAWLVSGFGIRHVFYYPGLIKPYLPHLLAMPVSERISFSVVLSFVAYLVSAALPIAVLLAIAARKRASIAEELGFNTHRFRQNLLYGVGGYAVALPLLFLGQKLGAHIPGPTPSNPAIPLLADAGTAWVQILLVALATLAAPLCEELLFRGVFYNAAKLKVGVWPAILLTGLIFGFVHPVGISEMVPLAVLGGVFAWMAETRKSLVPSMLGHFLQNSMATAMLLLALGR